MISSIFSFLGSAVVRVVLDKALKHFDDRQNHRQEIELMGLQASIAEQAKKNNIELLKLQAELNKEQLSYEYDKAEMEADYKNLYTSLSANKKSNIFVIDVMNGLIRPLITLIALIGIMTIGALFLPEYYANLSYPDRLEIGSVLHFTIIDGAFAVFGWWFGSRSLISGKK